MRRAWILPLVLVLATGSAVAQSGGAKMGVFDPNRILQETEEGKRVSAQITAAARRQQQMGYAWQQEQKKKKRAQEAQRIQSGGVNIKGVSGSVGIGRDVVGRDKIEQHTYQVDAGVEEKSGCLVFVERAFTFVKSLIIGGIVFAVLGVIIGGVLGGGEGGASGGVVVGLILALIFAVVAANNVSRHRQ